MDRRKIIAAGYYFLVKLASGLFVGCNRIRGDGTNGSRGVTIWSHWSYAYGDFRLRTLFSIAVVAMVTEIIGVGGSWNNAWARYCLTLLYK